MPAPWPRLEIVMRAGLLEFSGPSMRHGIFFVSATLVAIGFALLQYTRHYQRETRDVLLVVQVFFDLLTFPLFTQLSSVFSCVPASASSGEDGDGELSILFCDESSVPVDGACMRMRPDVACWGTGHHVYAAAALALLSSYYLAALYLQAWAQV
eukprot:COSAG01_NODE_1332_length_10695_cov_19.161854_5_plen_154_part_00